MSNIICSSVYTDTPVHQYTNTPIHQYTNTKGGLITINDTCNFNWYYTVECRSREVYFTLGHPCHAGEMHVFDLFRLFYKSYLRFVDSLLSCCHLSFCYTRQARCIVFSSVNRRFQMRQSTLCEPNRFFQYSHFPNQRKENSYQISENRRIISCQGRNKFFSNQFFSPFLSRNSLNITLYPGKYKVYEVYDMVVKTMTLHREQRFPQWLQPVYNIKHNANVYSQQLAHPTC